MDDGLLHTIKCVAAEFSNLLDVALTPTVIQSFDRNSQISILESEISPSWTYREIYYKFPTTNDNLCDSFRPTVIPSVLHLDKCTISRMNETAIIAEELASECDCEITEYNNVIREYRQSVNDLIHQYEYSEDKESESESETETEESATSDDSELRSTTKLLRSFYKAFTYVTRIVTAMLEEDTEQNTSNYLKKRTIELSQSTNKMIIYIESNLLYNFLLSKLNNIEKLAEEIEIYPLCELPKLFRTRVLKRAPFTTIVMLNFLSAGCKRIMAKDARDLTSTFKKLVNHFDMKRGSKTSGELIRSSFALEKSAKTFIFQIKKTLFLLSTKYHYGNVPLKTDYVQIFIESTRLIINLFLVEINKIVKSET